MAPPSGDSLEAPVEALHAGLDRAAAFYESVVTNQTEFVVRWRTDGTLTFVNPSYSRHLDRDPDALVGSSFFAGLEDSDLNLVRQNIGALSPATPFLKRQCRKPLSDGTWCWQEWTDHGVFDAGGTLTQLHSIGRDITAQKQVEGALAHSEERFFKAFHTSPVGFALTSMKDNRLLDVNEGFERMLGFSREEVVGKTSLELGTWVNEGDRQPLIDKLKRNEKVSQVEVAFRNRAGELGYCEVSIGGVIETNGEQSFVTVVHDITARKAAEDGLRRALEEVKELRDRLEAENVYLRDEIKHHQGGQHFLGDSEPYRITMRSLELVAPTDSSVLIVGESGTGKELVAQEIHQRSARRDEAMVRVNCAAIPQTLYESEFFGHVQGAFTGALRDRPGRFEVANGGTLFLDEIAEIPLETQSKLLRVLQEREYERVGDDATRTTDVRIIAATNRNLREEVAAGRFRNDLYFRLSVFPIEIAPLRERRSDIPVLARHFIRNICQRLNRPIVKLEEDDIAALMEFDWPGNARELQNVLERSIIASQGRRLELALPQSAPAQYAESHGAAALFVTDAEMKRRERDNIIAALQAADGQVFGSKGAAALLGLKPTTLTSRMKSLGIERLEHRASDKDKHA